MQYAYSIRMLLTNELISITVIKIACKRVLLVISSPFVHGITNYVFVENGSEDESYYNHLEYKNVIF